MINRIALMNPLNISLPVPVKAKGLSSKLVLLTDIVIFWLWPRDKIIQ
jgi:hypothetical protein